MDTTHLSFFIAEKKAVLVVTFVGPMERGSAHILEKCMQDIAGRQVTWVILNFRDVPGTIDRAVFPTLARLQKSVRDRKAQLRMTALHPSLRSALDQQGLLRPDETSNNLADALSSLIVRVPQAA